jgi:hypothetical protein
MKRILIGSSLIFFSIYIFYNVPCRADDKKICVTNNVTDKLFTIAVKIKGKVRVCSHGKTVSWPYMSLSHSYTKIYISATQTSSSTWSNWEPYDLSHGEERTDDLVLMHKNQVKPLRLTTTNTNEDTTIKLKVEQWPSKSVNAEEKETFPLLQKL